MSIRILWVFLESCYFIYYVGASIHKTSGDKKLVLESMGNCPDAGTKEVYIEHSSRKDDDGNVLHSGVVVLPYGLSDDLKGTGDIKKKNNDHWKPAFGLFSKIPFTQACSDMKAFAGSYWNELWSTVNLSHHECPIPKGTYNFTDAVINTNVDNLDLLDHGTYKLSLSLVRNGNKIGCIQVIADVLPTQ